jgi:hypothetical protein
MAAKAFAAKMHFFAQVQKRPKEAICGWWKKAFLK